MTAKIHSLISDTDLDIELLDDIKTRVLNQKHFYTSEDAAKLFYNRKANRPYLENSLQNEDYVRFFKDNALKNDGEDVALVSLACGDSHFERNVLDNIESKDRLMYIGIDSSRHMLDLSHENFKGCNIKKRFICGDFGSHNFRSEISYLLSKYKRSVFSLLGDTVGNIVPTNISDTLSNILRKGDMLWVTAALREGKDSSDDFKVFNCYVDYLKIPKTVEFYFGPLARVGVPFENGKMIVDMDKEDVIGALRFAFKFEFTKKTIIKFRNESIIILPGEKIELINIRVYDMEDFKNFFIDHGFKCVISERKGNRGQFLFEKE
jgi:hypothetical protein